jgi:hypothetical protein
MSRILNDRYNQFIIVSQTTLLSATFTDALDLLQMLNLKACVFAMLSLHEQRDENSPLGMCMNCAAGTAIKGSEEERRTLRWFECLRFTDVGFGGIVEDEDVGWFYEFFLDARGRKEDVIMLSDGGAATCSSDLIKRLYQLFVSSSRLVLVLVVLPSQGCRICGKAHRSG